MPETARELPHTADRSTFAVMTFSESGCVATALALSGPVRLGIALVLFIWGTVQRIRIEERLLRVSFGPEFDAYAARVPAVLPRFTS
jgi:protein-S-isoprenylcysteine O-methyltransferase Ste14